MEIDDLEERDRGPRMPTVAMPGASLREGYAMAGAPVDESFTRPRIAHLDDLRKTGDYNSALAAGERCFLENEGTPSGEPEALFLSEMAAYMCLLVDPLRNPRELQTWETRLNSLLGRFEIAQASGFGVFYLGALTILRDFCHYCRTYVETVEQPFERIMIGGTEFTLDSWGELFDSKIDALIKSNFVLIAAGQGDPRNRFQRTRWLLMRLKNMVARMRSATTAEADRWQKGMKALDRDSAIRTKILSQKLQGMLGGVKEQLERQILYYTQNEEPANSPLLRSTRLALIRCAIDRGDYSFATRAGEALIKQTPDSDLEFISQINGTIGYGLFVFAEMLLNHRNDEAVVGLLSRQAISFGINDDSNEDAVRKVIKMGAEYSQKALKFAGAGGKAQNSPLARQFRSQLLHGYNLEGATAAQNLLPSAINDVLNDSSNNAQNLAVRIPRIASALCFLAKKDGVKIINQFVSEDQKRPLVALLRESEHFLTQEAAIGERRITARNITPLGVAIQQGLKAIGGDLAFSDYELIEPAMAGDVDAVGENDAEDDGGNPIKDDVLPSPVVSATAFVPASRVEFSINHVPKAYYTLVKQKFETVRYVLREISGGARTGALHSAKSFR